MINTVVSLCDCCLQWMGEGGALVACEHAQVGAQLVRNRVAKPRDEKVMAPPHQTSCQIAFLLAMRMWLKGEPAHRLGHLSREGCLFERAFVEMGWSAMVHLLWHSGKEQIFLQSTMCMFLVSVSSTACADAVCRVSASHGISCYWCSINDHFNEDAQPVFIEDLSKVIIPVLGQVREGT